MKTILVPTDFSEQATNALYLATQIAKKSGAKILIVNVIEGIRNFSFNTMGESNAAMGEEAFLVRKLVEKVNERMAQLVSDSMFDGVEVATEVEMGSPYESISRVIAGHSADLVVMGTVGMSGLEEVLIGSNTEKVVRHAKCPVITLKKKVSLEDIQNIVFATNLDSDQTAVIERLKVMQEMTGAKLHLVKVNTPNHFHTQHQMEDEFENYLAKHKLSNTSTNIYNEITEEDGILRFAEDLGPCMIAIGTHGRTGLLHLLSGSIAEDLVNHADKPVWTMSMKHAK
ncbi:universal stress protein [Roseivirga misakiensis]|uniref:UspA domain-containing protein n=1 Tax=Roseivirga misakiensis TaxID=1563681 RepID=A0A1E5SKZ0_9BACT|nr:universal stress protein [Roseivirga misakiensis]OEJ99795.1 hypothetical protein BFP71_09545 [Roseivirga misakiensis]